MKWKLVTVNFENIVSTEKNLFPKRGFQLGKKLH